jgi:hypothetical protein
MYTFIGVRGYRLRISCRLRDSDCTCKLIFSVTFQVAIRFVRLCQGRVSNLLLTVKKTLKEYTIPILLMILLYLCTVNLYVKPTFAGFRHYWHVSPHAVQWASGRRFLTELMFPTVLLQKPSFPTLLISRSSFVHRDNLLLLRAKRGFQQFSLVCADE